jgi:hypothetical protein
MELFQDKSYLEQSVNGKDTEKIQGKGFKLTPQRIAI